MITLTRPHNTPLPSPLRPNWIIDDKLSISGSATRSPLHRALPAKGRARAVRCSAGRSGIPNPSVPKRGASRDAPSRAGPVERTRYDRANGNNKSYCSAFLWSQFAMYSVVKNGMFSGNQPHAFGRSYRLWFALCACIIEQQKYCICLQSIDFIPS
jgi:hypothetical protein